MARNTNLREKRDSKLRKRYEQFSKDHPEWRHGAILAKIAEEFFIEERTASAIFNCEGVYAATA